MNLNDLKSGDPVSVGNSPLKMFFIGPMRNEAFVQVEDELGNSRPAATSTLAPWLECSESKRDAIAKEMKSLSFGGTRVWELADQVSALKDYRAEWEREYDNTNKLLGWVGLAPEQYRTEGGSLNVHKTQELLLEAFEVGRTIVAGMPAGVVFYTAYNSPSTTSVIWNGAKPKPGTHVYLEPPASPPVPAGPSNDRCQQ